MNLHRANPIWEAVLEMMFLERFFRLRGSRGWMAGWVGGSVGKWVLGSRVWRSEWAVCVGVGYFTILRKLLSQILNSFSKAASSSVTLVSAQGRLAKANDKSSDDATSADDCATLICQAFTLGRDFFRNHLFTCAFSASTFQVTRELNFSLHALSPVIFPFAQNETRLKSYTSPAIRSFFSGGQPPHNV